MATHAYLEATDGQRKCWMFDSKTYELPAGRRGLFPLEVAEQARAYFSPWTEDGRADSSVEVTPVEGELETVERGALPKFACTRCGTFETHEAAEFTEHVTACVTGCNQKGGA